MDRFADLKRYEADVALRMTRKPPQDLYHVDLGPLALRVYGARDADRQSQRFIGWPGIQAVPQNVSVALPDLQLGMVVDGYLATQEMIRIGAGVGMLPEFMAYDDEMIKPLTPRINNGLRIFALCLPEQRNLLRLRTFVRFFQRSIQEGGLLQNE